MRALLALMVLSLVAGCTGSPVLLGDAARLEQVGEEAHLALLLGRYEDALPDESPKLIVALYFVHPPAGLGSIEQGFRQGVNPGLRLTWSLASGPRAGLPQVVRAEISPRSGGLRIREKEYRLEEGRVFIVEAHDDGTVSSRQVAAHPPADWDALLDVLDGETL